MAYSRRGWCDDCRRNVAGEFVYPEFIRESTLLVLSCGLWLPVWLWRISRRRWSCPRCGLLVRT